MQISGGCSAAPEVLRRLKRVTPKRPGGLGVRWGVAKPRHAMRVLGCTFLWYSLCVCVACMCALCDVAERERKKESEREKRERLQLSRRCVV